MVSQDCAVVPGYYLVCYNIAASVILPASAVVPGYYLVCYNRGEVMNRPREL